MIPKAKIKGEVCKDRISELPDELLLQILSQVPTDDAVTTMVLSKRWRFVWTMIPKLEYLQSNRTNMKNVWNLLENSMQLHRAPLLESLSIRFYNEYASHARSVKKWVTYAVEHCVRELNFEFHQLKILPDCFYTCKTLVRLTLSKNILVDVPSLPSLPSLQSLTLASVVYKDQDSHVKLLSCCPVLKHLDVFRNKPDNVKSFIVKVASLERLKYRDIIYEGRGGSLFIDSSGLNHVEICGPFIHYFSIQHMPGLAVADLRFGSPKNENILTSISSVMSLKFDLSKFVYFSTINFSRLIELKICTDRSLVSFALEALMLLLHSAPLLKILVIDLFYNVHTFSWNQPSSVPVCLLSHFEVFDWKSYLGSREENEMVAYILANSKCLKTAGICLPSDYNDEKRQKMKDELRSMYRVSSSSQLLFC